MHVGKSYKAREFFVWSREKLLALLIISTVPVLLNVLLGFKGTLIPWSVILLLGTTVAFITAFKNTQTYNRNLEAQNAWASISSGSRQWGAICHDFLNADAARDLIYRHLAWLTTLRFALRTPRPWETADQKVNVEWKSRYRILEQETTLSDQLASYASADDFETILEASNRPVRVLQLQSAKLKSLLDAGAMPIQAYLEMLKIIRDMHDQQSRSERIKNFPYPRQYAVVSAMFVTIFCILLPFGMVSQFEALSEHIEGFMKGHMVWLVIPFTVLIGWMYTSLDQVGEGTSNPFEGGANDVPISQISRTIEIELKELIGESDIPAPWEPENAIAT